MSLFSIQTVTRTADEFLAYFKKEVRSIEQKEFKSLLRKFRHARLMDVSTKDEFMELHIPGSMNCDVLSPKFIYRMKEMDRTKPYFLYCRNGKRSEAAMRIMEELGFRRVYSLVSGLETWKGTVARLI